MMLIPLKKWLRGCAGENRHVSLADGGEKGGLI